MVFMCKSESVLLVRKLFKTEYRTLEDCVHKRITFVCCFLIFFKNLFHFYAKIRKEYFKLEY